MNKIKLAKLNKLLNILDIQEKSRQIGHTTAALEGAVNSDSILIVHNRCVGLRLEEENRSLDWMTLNDLVELIDENKVPKTAIIFDNAVLNVISNQIKNLIEEY